MIEESIEVVQTTTTNQSKRQPIPNERPRQQPPAIRNGGGGRFTCIPCAPCAERVDPSRSANATTSSSGRSYSGRTSPSNGSPLRSPPRAPPVVLPPGHGKYIIPSTPATYFHDDPDGTTTSGEFQTPQVLGTFEVGHDTETKELFAPPKASTPVPGHEYQGEIVSYEEPSCSGNEFSSVPPDNSFGSYLDSLDESEISNLEQNMASFQDSRRNVIMQLLNIS